MATETLSTPGAGTYTVPAGVFELTVESIGAGGGGSGGAVSESHEGSGGSGGARQTATFAVAPGQGIDYSIGAGGAGGAADAAGSDGGATSFDGVTTAAGGFGGGLLGSGGSPPSGNSGGGAGGNSGSAGSNGGGGGGARGESDAGGDSGEAGNAGGAGASIGGGNGATSADTAGANGASGGGGGGGKGDAAGGNGGNGVIFLTYTVRVAPSDIALDDASIPEDASIGDTVGTLSATDADAGDTATFSLIDDAGGRFAIDTAALKVAAALDHEAHPTHTVTVRATDSYGLYREEDFVITVTNVNEAPTDIALSNTTVATGSAIGTTVGTLSATDPDAGDSVTFSLAAATLDNDDFTIDGTALKIGFTADAATRDSYTVTVTGHDDGGLTFDENFTITVEAVSTRKRPTMFPKIQGLLSYGALTNDTTIGATLSLAQSNLSAVPSGSTGVLVQSTGNDVRFGKTASTNSSTGLVLAEDDPPVHLPIPSSGSWEFYLPAGTTVGLQFCF